MGLFFPDDDVDYSVRQTGFNRYKQLLSEHAFNWLKISLLTTVGALPLCLAIAVSIMSTSILLLFPLSFLCGMAFGPFYSALFDNILRGLRDAPGSWFDQYKKGFRQNLKSSLIPGGIFGVLVAAYTFMGFLMYWRTAPLSTFTIVMYFVSALIMLTINTLFWTLHVLFDQTIAGRIANIISFSSKYLWKILAQSLLQLAVLGLTVMLAPWSLFLVPFLAWYFRFLIEYKLYEPLNEFFRIEEQINEKTQLEKQG